MAQKKKNKYRSKFEADFAALYPQLPYETAKIHYVTDHVYTPDFESKKYYIELKGVFKTAAERKKYISARTAINQWPKSKQKEIVFIFYSPDTPLPGSKRRKDGTRMSHKEWAELNEFKWAVKEAVPKAWLRV